MKTVYRIEHDGFVGVQVGSYTTREGKEGVVLQQVGTQVVHVYGKKWLTMVGYLDKDSNVVAVKPNDPA